MLQWPGTLLLLRSMRSDAAEPNHVSWSAHAVVCDRCDGWFAWIARPIRGWNIFGEFINGFSCAELIGGRHTWGLHKSIGNNLYFAAIYLLWIRFFFSCLFHSATLSVHQEESSAGDKIHVTIENHRICLWHRLHSICFYWYCFS